MIVWFEEWQELGVFQDFVVYQPNQVLEGFQLLVGCGPHFGFIGWVGYRLMISSYAIKDVQLQPRNRPISFFKSGNWGFAQEVMDIDRGNWVVVKPRRGSKLFDMCIGCDMYTLSPTTGIGEFAVVKRVWLLLLKVGLFLVPLVCELPVDDVAFDQKSADQSHEGRVQGMPGVVSVSKALCCFAKNGSAKVSSVVSLFVSNKFFLCCNALVNVLLSGMAFNPNNGNCRGCFSFGSLPEVLPQISIGDKLPWSFGLFTFSEHA